MDIKFFDMIHNNQVFFTNDIILEVTLTTRDLYGETMIDTRINIDIQFGEVIEDVLMLRIIQSMGILNEFTADLQNQAFAAGIYDSVVKSGKIYYLKIAIGYDSIKVIERRGFGLFYNIGVMYDLMLSISVDYPTYIVKQSFLNDNNKDIIKNLTKKMNFGTTTNKLLEEYFKIINI